MVGVASCIINHIGASSPNNPLHLSDYAVTGGVSEHLQCPLRVIRVVLTVGQRLPVQPDQRNSQGTSARLKDPPTDVPPSRPISTQRPEWCRLGPASQPVGSNRRVFLATRGHTDLACLP